MVQKPSSITSLEESKGPSASLRQATTSQPQENIKTVVTNGLQSLLSWSYNRGPTPKNKPTVTDLFPKVDPRVDGDDCDHDCASCSISYPRGFKIEENLKLYGGVKPWETHLIVATGKSDWVREVADEKGSVMEAIGSVKGMKLSASNMPLPQGSISYTDPTRVLLLPAMTMIENVTPNNVKTLVNEHIIPSVKTVTPMAENENASANGGRQSNPLADQFQKNLISNGDQALDEVSEAEASLSRRIVPILEARPCPHNTIIFLCSQRTRDARCGQSAPLIRRELERHLRPLNLYRDLDDERPGGVGIYFISHVGGHKWSANVIIYRRPDPWGVDEKGRGEGHDIEDLVKKAVANANHKDHEPPRKTTATQCIWLARIKPADCEGIVKYTVLQGKVVKPEWQLRGGFDRARGLVSW